MLNIHLQDLSTVWFAEFYFLAEMFQEMDGPWAVHGGLTGRSKRLKVDGFRPKWTVQKTQSGRSAKVDGPEIQKWTVQREMTLRSEVLNLDGLKG